MNEFGNQLGAAVIGSMALEVLKNSSWFPFINKLSTSKYKAAIGCLVALCASAGISYTFDYTASNGGQIIFHLPALHTIIDFLKQWAFQEYVYRTGVKEKDTGSYVTLDTLGRFK